MIEEEEEKKPKRPKNDIKDIKSLRQLERVKLDLESPRFVSACYNLGISIEECKKISKEQFFERGLDESIANLRYKHFCGRLIDTINSILEERRQIKMKQ
mmetsp:Transcript_16657/g.15954  ORF Transcript_16657/g.15954 Transcript_16657/m.15954 type:complete len:100 (+) Transcript_16657:89-388(+)